MTVLPWGGSHLQRLHRKYFRQGLRIVGVAPLSATLSEIRAFARRHGLTYPTLIDPSATVARLYRVAEYPATVVIDRRGTNRFLHRGFRSGEEQLLERVVRATLYGRPVRSRE